LLGSALSLQAAVLFTGALRLDRDRNLLPNPK
jgi:hypothetical protein